MAKYRADQAPQKVDLGVGVYRDFVGNTPILRCVRQAEQTVLGAQTTKSYVGPAGREEFNSAVEEWVLGGAHGARRERRFRTVQAAGGCGALRVGAELIRDSTPSATVYVSDPTWGNHMALLGSSALLLERYPYYDSNTHTLCFDRMLERLERALAGDVVLLHACCHNPTGADLSPGQWQALLELLLRRRLVPFLDLAYQGFGQDSSADVAGLRLITEAVPEALIAVSFSKNLGLYRERVGALLVLSETSARADAVHSHVLQIARSIYSMPPDHGAAIAACIFADPQLRKDWLEELGSMRDRVQSMRVLLTQQLKIATGNTRFDFLQHQRGLFSLLGASPAAVQQLRQQHHIYMTADSRMNLAGIMPHNAPYVAKCIAAVLQA